MLKSLEVIASRAAPTQREAGPGIKTRRVQGYFDMRAPSTDSTGEQLNAFRGTIYAAVDKVAKRIAQLPIQLYETSHERDGEVKEKRVHIHPFLNLMAPGFMHRPHEEYSTWEFDYWHQVSMDLAGEAWWLVERNDAGMPIRVTPLPANRMTVVYNEDTGAIGGYMFVPKGQVFQNGIFIPKLSFERLHRDKNLPFMVFHRYPAPHGIEDSRGWSPVKAAAYAYDINLYEQIYKRNFLTNGAQLGGILQSEIALSKEQVEEYLHQFESRHKGVKNAGMPVVLPKMLKWTTTEPTPRDIQWVETMGATESMILQIYGISDAKLGRADIGNRSTAEAMDVTFNREVIQSRLDQKKSKIDSDFLPIYEGQSEHKHLVARYDDPVPADAEMAMKREDQDIKNAVITRNEAREKRGMNKMGKFGDSVFMPMTHVPMDPFDKTTLENVQDDKEDNGYIKKEEPADPAADPADDKEDDDAEKRVGRLLQRSVPPDEVIAEIVALMASSDVAEQFLRSVAGVAIAAIDSEVSAAAELLGESVVADIADSIAVDWLRHLSLQIRGINKTTSDAVAYALVQGYEQGKSVSDIAFDIQQVFEDASESRALTIARTEILGASNFAANETYRRFGAQYKRWVSIPDERRRDTHGEAEGQTVPIDAKFTVGSAELDHPGDPSGPAEEIINCRCFIIPVSGPDGESDRAAAIWRAFDTRMSAWEEKFAGAVRDVFAYQMDRVVEVLNEAR